MKASPILVAPQIDLRQLSDQERDVLRRVLFDCIRGLNQQHDKRWRRMWGRLFNAAEGEVLHLISAEQRSSPFHRMHMAMEQRLFDSQEVFTNLDKFRDWLKTGAGWGEYKLSARGVLKFEPKSLSYESASDDEMREVHAAMVDFLHTPRAQRYLWAHLPAAERVEMLERAIHPPEVE